MTKEEFESLPKNEQIRFVNFSLDYFQIYFILDNDSNKSTRSRKNV